MFRSVRGRMVLSLLCSGWRVRVLARTCGCGCTTMLMMMMMRTTMMGDVVCVCVAYWRVRVVPRNFRSYRQPQSKCSRLCFFIIDGYRSAGSRLHGRGRRRRWRTRRLRRRRGGRAHSSGWEGGPAPYGGLGRRRRRRRRGASGLSLLLPVRATTGNVTGQRQRRQ